MTPQVHENYFSERAGILALAAALNQMHLVWRETPNADVGIDGQIELIGEDGEATGRIVAAQVKSGSSYIHVRDSHLLFTPQAKHVSYWRRFPIPVLLFIYDPKEHETYWVDARRQLLLPDSPGSLVVPIRNTVSASSRTSFFESYGPTATSSLTTAELARGLAAIRTNTEPSISALELFLAGMTDIATKLFFDLSLLFEVADYSEVELLNSDIIHPFVDSYVAYLFQHSLTRYDFADYLVDLDRELQPTFIARLTDKGLGVRDYAAELCRSRGFAPPRLSIAEERMVRTSPNGREQIRFNAARATAAAIVSAK